MSTVKRNWVLLLPTGGLLACVALLASRGASGVTGGLGAVAATWFTGGSAAVIWMAGALGIGLKVCRAVLGERSCLLGVALPVGIAVCLWLAHGVGAIGVLRGAPGMVAAWAAPAAGALLLWREVRGRGGGWRGRGVEVVGVPWGVRWVMIPGAAVLIVAPCLPPGTIWASEAHGYDALSYHLMLAREWIGAGRIGPVEHNVYSFLPSYMEAAYAQLAVMLGAGLDARGTSALGGGGRWVFAAQSLHTLMGVATGVSVASLVRVLLGRAARPVAGADVCAAVAGGAVVSVPWTAITGTLAYNELGMTACLAGAVVLASQAWDRPAAQGALIGLLLGASAMCKPTAVYMGWPLVIVCAAAWLPAVGRLGLGAGALVGGVVGVAPWLLRNALVGTGGNPVFPYFTGLFGARHWDAEQVARWNAAHHPGRGLFDSFARLASDAGLLNPQWLAFAGLLVVGVFVVLAWGGARRVGWPLVLGLALQLLAWVLVGHQQARFLMPIIVPGSAVLGLAVGGWGLASRRRVGVAAGAAAVGALGLSSTYFFVNEGGGRPCRALEIGVAGITGDALGSDAALRALPERELVDLLRSAENPVAATNRLVGLEAARARERGEPEPLVYLLGDATPLYFTVPILWNTTWDAWPLDRAMRAPGAGETGAGEAGMAARNGADELRRLGVTHLLINFAELDRLRRSGYSPAGMTPELAGRFANEACSPIVVWERLGCGLFRLRAPG